MFIVNGVKVLCFDTLLQVLILKVDREPDETRTETKDNAEIAEGSQSHTPENAELGRCGPPPLGATQKVIKTKGLREKRFVRPMKTKRRQNWILRWDSLRLGVWREKTCGRLGCWARRGLTGRRIDKDQSNVARRSRLTLDLFGVNDSKGGTRGQLVGGTVEVQVDTLLNQGEMPWKPRCKDGIWNAGQEGEASRPAVSLISLVVWDDYGGCRRTGVSSIILGADHNRIEPAALIRAIAPGFE